MRMTRQEHIDPLVQKVQKCGSKGCGPGSIQVMFTRPRGYITNFDPVWVCSSGHCSDYDEIPSLRKPEDCPVTWVQQNALAIVRAVGTKLCMSHDDPEFADLTWGQSGHLWGDGHHQEVKLCLPRLIKE